MTYDLRHGIPASFSQAEQEAFAELVFSAGEVKSKPVLMANLEAARALVMLYDGGKLGGTAALKDPQNSYREGITQSAGYELPAARYPFELGNVFLAQRLRGKKLARQLVDTAMSYADGLGVFATAQIENEPMQILFEKAGFEPVGEEYSNTSLRGIRLFVREAVAAKS